jgi:hypothetical protein
MEVGAEPPFAWLVVMIAGLLGFVAVRQRSRAS